MADTFKVRVSMPIPQLLASEQIPTGYVTGSDGVRRASGYRIFVATLLRREMTVESRGYLSESEATAALNGKTNSISVATSGTYSFEQKTVGYEAQRINDADMWRIVKTVTIAALYVDGSYTAGKTAFDTGDDSL